MGAFTDNLADKTVLYHEGMVGLENRIRDKVLKEVIELLESEKSRIFALDFLNENGMAVPRSVWISFIKEHFKV